MDQTCHACGCRMDARDLARGLAHARDHRPFCVRCLPTYAVAPTPTVPVATRQEDFLPLRACSA
jgi:hypothetical protein